MNAAHRRTAREQYRSMHGTSPRPSWGAVTVLMVGWALMAVVVLVALAAVFLTFAWIGSSLARLWMNGGGL